LFYTSVSIVAHLRLRALLGTAQSFTGEGNEGKKGGEGGRREIEEDGGRYRGTREQKKGGRREWEEGRREGGGRREYEKSGGK
jgi:hypothetical protein